MSWRGTLALAATLLIATGYAYFDLTSGTPRASWERSTLPRATPLAQNLKRLLEFDPDTISGIHLRRDALDAQVVRDENGWAGVARPQVLNSFLRSLQELTEIMPLDVSLETLADYGLAPPQGVIELHSEDHPPIVLLLGHRNPPATAVYAQVGADGSVVLTGELLRREFDNALKAATTPG